MDPFLGNPNNFCGAAGNGCTAAHAPGYLTSGDVVTEVRPSVEFPVGVTENNFDVTVTVTSGTNTVTFNFTSISTNVLTNGALDLVLTGTFGGDTAKITYQARRPTCRLVVPNRSRAARSLVQRRLRAHRRRSQAMSPSRRRWRCSAPHCSALARCAAAVALISTIASVRADGPAVVLKRELLLTGSALGAAAHHEPRWWSPRDDRIVEWRADLEYHGS